MSLLTHRGASAYQADPAYLLLHNPVATLEQRLFTAILTQAKSDLEERPYEGMPSINQRRLLKDKLSALKFFTEPRTSFEAMAVYCNLDPDCVREALRSQFIRARWDVRRLEARIQLRKHAHEAHRQQLVECRHLWTKGFVPTEIATKLGVSVGCVRTALGVGWCRSGSRTLRPRKPYKGRRQGWVVVGYSAQ